MSTEPSERGDSPKGEGSALAARKESEELVEYLLEMGCALATYGCPSYRLEDVIRLVAEARGKQAEPFALPTGLFVDVGGVHRMRRLPSSTVDLDRLEHVDAIFNDVAYGRTTIERARVRIREVTQKPPHWPAWMLWLASAAAAGSAAIFFRGGIVEIVTSALVGAVIGGLRALPSRRQSHKLLDDFLGGLLAAACGSLALAWWPTSAPEVVVRAGAISLFPGMTFTTGIAEVTQKNLVSGGARMMEAGVTLLLIVFGVALVVGLEGVLGVARPSMPETLVGLPWPWHVGALVVSSLSFGIVFQVPTRWMWAALASGATGYLATLLATRYFTPAHGYLAAFVAALAVCLFANCVARATDRPAQLFQLPGMMLLVPGSFGFVSLSGFLRGRVEAGAQAGFTMALVGAAIVIGVLVANVLLPPRKLL